ncbi:MULTISPECIES: helix-turn-helix domain-containing protein [unclassified Duganella]|uniref:helix-turn-helix domain-containing protein n=1 Tax=unclassified Duganella TaxID=2636909 RepID=UPI0006F836D7|nr:MULTISPECIES: AraC family transcriptional regulator [unclassified Duganella]KQV47569.1 AraC family transcriptional regulator [Duganella sp. Root336D2]KRC00018.1 AraC family transcriptional regulator [Duganella sp. Root198D2]
MTNRPTCYPVREEVPLLDVLTSPVPHGRFDSPVDGRHVLCLHLGAPVPVSYRACRYERQGTRLHGQFCVVPAGSSTRWTLTAPATSLLLRLNPSLMRETAEHMRLGAELAPAIHLRDPQIEHIGWMMRAEEQDGHPSGRIFADSLASALAARLLALQTPASRLPAAAPARALPAWRLRAVQDYIEARLDQELTLAELAAVAGFSVSHFKELFRQAAGMPVHRFVLARRVERARQLLQEGMLTNTEIALEAGFSHPSHMARSVRQVLGLTPAQLRDDGLRKIKSAVFVSK